VVDRTAGELHPADSWSFNADSGLVTLTGAEPFHVYTASFLVHVIWDTTSMYNHIVNNWTGPHIKSVDPYHEAIWDELMEFYDRWLDERPDTDVVRLTTLAYHFNLDVSPDAGDKFRDWTGYQETLSLEALRHFEAEYGYRLRAEDFVDEGYYNAVSRVPSRKYLDWMKFVHRFVVRFGKELADRAHAAGKETAIFWGDHWIGVEPYSPHFQEMGIDIHVGACADGVALRRVADAPGGQVKELRFFPYFFPDVFSEGGDPLGESVANWVKIRRALLRKPVDRIGYGGYTGLVENFPDFAEHVSRICDEFRAFKTMSKGTESEKAPVRVAVLNAWGRLRSWINSFGAPQKFLEKRPDVTVVAGTNLLECLAGLPVEVEFVNFDDIRGGVPERIDVIVNDGDAGTAWSGGRHWRDPAVASAVREFVHRGGGFIGCRGPTACEGGGRFFQLSDVLGVERETGQGVQFLPPRPSPEPDHFITRDGGGPGGSPSPEGRGAGGSAGPRGGSTDSDAADGGGPAGSVASGGGSDRSAARQDGPGDSTSPGGGSSDSVGRGGEPGDSTSPDAWKAGLRSPDGPTTGASRGQGGGGAESFVYACRDSTRVLRESGGHVLLATNEFGEGRSVYVAALPFSLENARLLYRAILSSAGREDALKMWHTTNVKTDCAAYPEAGAFVVVNNSQTEETTTLFDGNCTPSDLTLAPLESRWYGI